MGYLFCEKCESIYKLLPDDSPADFDKCECGGELIYYDILEDLGNPDKAKKLSHLMFICPNVKCENTQFLSEKGSCPKCGYLGKNVDKYSLRKIKRDKKNNSTKPKDTPIPMKISMLLVVGLLIIGWMVILSNFFESNVPASPTTSQPSPTTTSQSSTTPSDNSVIVEVNYAGPWKGAIEDNTGGRSEQGSGSKYFSLGNDPGIVSTNFQKMDNSSESLEVEIIYNNDILEIQSTTAQYGIASISHSF